jgi:gluconokinase
MPVHNGLYAVMGVAGSGKSLIGAALAHALEIEFVEGDDFHSARNITRMASGIPLTDVDRADWLNALAKRISGARKAGNGLVVACSALKRSYRDILRRDSPELRFIFLNGSRELIATRLAGRGGHFMPPTLLDSQFATLEVPSADERAWVCDIDNSPDSIVANLVDLISPS